MLQVIDLEDSNPFEDDFRVRCESVYTYENIQTIIYGYIYEVRKWLALNILAYPRSRESCDLFLSTYAYGAKGLERLARLCCMTTPGEVFVDSMLRGENQVEGYETLKFSIFFRFFFQSAQE